MFSPSKNLWKLTTGAPGRFWFHMLLLVGSVSLRLLTARLYRAQLAFSSKRFEPTTVCHPLSISIRDKNTRKTYVVYRVVSRVDRVTAGCAPLVQCVLVDERIAALEVVGELEERIVLAFDVRPRDLLLQNTTAPVIFEPRMLDRLLVCVREQKRVVFACDVKVNLVVDHVVMKGTHFTYTGQPRTDA